MEGPSLLELSKDMDWMRLANRDLAFNKCVCAETVFLCCFLVLPSYDKPNNTGTRQM